MLLRALLEVRGLTPEREMSEARALWTAVERDAPRMNTPFDEEWFASLLAAHCGRISSIRVASAVLGASHAVETPLGGTERAQDWGDAPDRADSSGAVEELTC